MWINPDSDYASPQMWTHSLPVPIHPGSSTSAAFLLEATWPMQSLTPHSESLIIVPTGKAMVSVK